MNARLSHILQISFAVTFLLLHTPLESEALDIPRPDKELLQRVFSYSTKVDSGDIKCETTYSYTKYSLYIRKRNITLLAVPTMWAVAHGGKRHYLGENYEQIKISNKNQSEVQRLIGLSTIPSHRESLTTVSKYLTPDIYAPTIFKDNILSPFHVANQQYYHYQVTFLLNGTARINFRPKVDNTQLVRGQALVNYSDGRIISMTLDGEYDMVTFSLGLLMGTTGTKSLLPSDIKLNCKFNFLGNITEGSYRSIYNLPEVIPDSVLKNNSNYMELVRPIPLTNREKELYATEQRNKEHKDSVGRTLSEKKHLWKHILWDIVGNNVVNRIKSDFGKNNEGYLRINPILNPLYMGYDYKRGFTYKFDVRLNYMFSPNIILTTRLKAGYSFKQKQPHISVPTMFWYNKNRNGYIQLEIGNGNWISNGNAANYARKEVGDSVINQYPRIYYFKDSYAKILNNYDINAHWGIQAGLIFHRRKAVEPEVYKKARMPLQYISVAPLFELQWRPTGWYGPYVVLDYERGIKHFLKGDIDYERWELDAQWKLKLQQLKTLQMRMGVGCYTLQDGHTFFLDYSNFRENHVPGGWNDDWSGEFELLNSDKYNESRWYMRGNITYESPLLAVSHLPWTGHFIEMERLYASILASKNCHPYIELGYGFTTRLFSMGLFLSNDSGEIKEFGCKFGFELFRHW